MKSTKWFCIGVLLVLFAACGKTEQPPSTESQIAGALQRVPELQKFLDDARLKLARKVPQGGAKSLVTQSPVQVAAAVAEGKASGEFTGCPVAWAGTIYDPIPGGMTVYAVEGEKRLLVRLRWGDVGGDIAKKLKPTGWIVFGGKITQASAEAIEVGEAFVTAQAVEGETLSTQEFLDEAADAVKASAN